MTGHASRELLETPPLAIYVHLPWCVRKCPYCDFNSHALRGPLQEDAYLGALLLDIEKAAQMVSGREAVSLFFGGGTPSLFGPDTIGRVVDALHGRGLLAADAEVTLEANPGAIEHGSFRSYADAGINRVSLGVQSFDQQKLVRIGRIHTPDNARAAIDHLSSAGIDNFNIDLMYGLPEQSPEDAARDVRLALAAGAPHLSHYQLTIEPNTLFHAKPPPLPHDDDIWEMQVSCQELIAADGLSQYEVSAYARPGKQCRHNLNYWTYGDYLGVGAGAHGKLTFSDRGRIERRAKYRHPDTYMNAPDEDQAAVAVGLAERVFEFMLNSLRLSAGFALECFEKRTGVPGSGIEGRLGQAAERGLLQEDNRPGWRPTTLGRRYLNDLQAIFLPREPA